METKDAELTERRRSRTKSEWATSTRMMIRPVSSSRGSAVRNIVSCIICCGGGGGDDFSRPYQPTLAAAAAVASTPRASSKSQHHVIGITERRCHRDRSANVSSISQLVGTYLYRRTRSAERRRPIEHSDSSESRRQTGGAFTFLTTSPATDASSSLCDNSLDVAAVAVAAESFVRLVAKERASCRRDTSALNHRPTLSHCVPPPPWLSSWLLNSFAAAAFVFTCQVGSRATLAVICRTATGAPSVGAGASKLPPPRHSSAPARRRSSCSPRDDRDNRDDEARRKH